MEKFVIRGGKPLCGVVDISGSKNAALPILAATLLTEGVVTLHNMPVLSDILIMCEILESLGCRVNFLGNDCIQIDTRNLNNQTVSYSLAGRLRGSFLVMGPLLAKTGYVSISMPGGCPIGARPIDLHVKGLTALGAEIVNTGGSIIARADTLKGTKIYLDFPSVGATENIMSAAVLAEGETVIENAAVEPEIVDLANFLQKMGAEIGGAGTDTVTIMGKTSLMPAKFSVISDRIEAGTYLALAAATGGQITVRNIFPDYVKPLTAKMTEMGIDLTVCKDSITVKSDGTHHAVDIKTLPFPGFPTDMQAQMTALLTVSSGTGIVTETIFENRFMHASELCRMGASIKVAGRSAVIEGKKALTGAKVKATDLRAGAAMVIAGLSARGDTEISDIYHIDRGYVGMEKKLQSLGAEIYRTKEN
ncbi:MAG: UDP-N-acetylglucosamine 1-carboxyvinyltransferase [Clostridia bacterium]|nr:UDP-N-acetylglucosamine 1-carboxyvinyltransferase [Clostridia bacterium]